MSSFTRREAIAGAAGILAVTPEVAFTSQANSAVSFAIIGTGGRGQYVGGLMSRDPRARLSAICDIFDDKLDAARKNIPAANAKVYKDYNQVLGDRSIDAVLISTPVYLHPEMFEAAVASKKHIYCEKPAGASVAGVKRLAKAAEQIDPTRTVQFGFQQRFSPEYRAAHDLVAKGDLGDLKILESYWILGSAPSFTPPANPAWGRYPAAEARLRYWLRWMDLSGGDIVESDCHGLDVLNWFAGSHPVSALGQGGVRYPVFYGDITSDHHNIIYTYPNGAVGHLLSARQTAGFRDVKERFFGARGMLETARTYYKLHGPVAASRLTNDDKLEDTSMVRRVDSKREITMDAVEHFFTSIVDSKPINMAPSAVESTFTSLLGRMAFEFKREVTWEEMLRSA
jgi:predicted dehydrogenase